MVATELNTQIIRNYHSWLAAEGFGERPGQRQMIGFIANTLRSEESPHAIVQAGTGTGKTAAYIHGAVPVAAAKERFLIIVTATVALQQQVVEKDLPGLSKWSDKPFTFTVAKGRRRYVCTRRLRNLVETPEQKPLLDGADRTQRHMGVYRQMYQALEQNQWPGDRDSWSDEITTPMWSPISTDFRGCTNRECEDYGECPYFRERKKFAVSNVIVTNYDLLLTSLVTGAEVLPDPKNSIYIFDEAHHLVDKTMSAFRSSMELKGTLNLIDDCRKLLSELMNSAKFNPAMKSNYDAFAEHSVKCKKLTQRLLNYAQNLNYVDEQSGRGVYRFKQGLVPKKLAAVCALLADQQASLLKCLQVFNDELDLVSTAESDWLREELVERYVEPIRDDIGYLEETTELLRAYGWVGEDQKFSAKWVQHDTGSGLEDWRMTLVPVEVDAILSDIIWSRCKGAVFTSATLDTEEEFTYFKNAVGLPLKTRHLDIPSPFDYQKAVTLTVPQMKHSPRSAEYGSFVSEVIQKLPARLELEQSALVLFSSRAMLSEVYEGLPPKYRRRILVQDTMGKQALLDKHKHLIDTGKPSYVFGTESYREGIDLPGDYCKHVIVTKLPFAVPIDPIEKTREEYFSARGANYFFDISVPETTLRLVQGFGRLIRNERDRGRITMFDKRFAFSNYGRRMQSSIPPYDVQIER